MPANYSNFPPEQAERIDRLSRLIYELRENRRAVLAIHAVADAEGLLGRIAAGEVAEHPAYEHYLSARILESSRQSLRSELGELLARMERT